MTAPLPTPDEPRGGPPGRMADVFHLFKRRIGLTNENPAHPRFAAEFAASSERRKAAGRSPDVDPTDEGGITSAEGTSRMQQRARHAALDAALPVAFQHARPGLASLDPDQHPDKLAAWLHDPGCLILVLSGRTGCGKTVAAYALAAEACYYGAATSGGIRELVVRSWTVNDYVAELRPNGSDRAEGTTRSLARSAELLLLDDLGAESEGAATGAVRRELEGLIDYRLRCRLRTVITTNLPSQKVADMYGERIISRLSEHATGIQFRGRDRRQIKPLDW